MSGPKMTNPGKQDKSAQHHHVKHKDASVKNPQQELVAPSYDETPFYPHMNDHAGQLAKVQSAESRADLVMRLQQTYGNSYVQRLVESAGIQAKLSVSSPGDIHEKEADRVAEAVSSAIEARGLKREEEDQDLLRQVEEEEEEEMQPKLELHRQPEEEEEEELQAKSLIQRQEEEEMLPRTTIQMQEELPEEELQAERIQRQEEEEEEMQPKLELQRQEEEEEEILPKTALHLQEDEEEMQMQSEVAEPPVATATIENRINTARGGGQGLADDARVPMEQAFGSDFGGVRVHTDSEADDLNRNLNAKAFTTGKDVFFRHGEYNPGSSEGRNLLAHELTHVVQQTGSSVDRERLSTTSCDRVQRNLSIINPAVYDTVQRGFFASIFGKKGIKFPSRSKMAKDATVESNRAADWTAGEGDCLERSGWIMWNKDTDTFSVVDKQTGDEHGVDPGSKPDDNPPNYHVGHYHQHPPLNADMEQEVADGTASYPVGPSPEDKTFAKDNDSPGLVRDYKNTKRKAVKDYTYGSSKRKKE